VCLSDQDRMLPRNRGDYEEKLAHCCSNCSAMVNAARAQNARAALDAAAAALGATNLRSIEFSGRGFDFMFGQAYDGNSAWPRFSVPRYTVTIDYRHRPFGTIGRGCRFKIHLWAAVSTDRGRASADLGPERTRAGTWWDRMPSLQNLNATCAQPLKDGLVKSG